MRLHVFIILTKKGVRSGIRTHAYKSRLRPERSALDRSVIMTYTWLWSKSLVTEELKTLANENTLLPTQMFPRLPASQHLLRTQILCSGHKKCFWFFWATFCVYNKCFPVCAEWKHNIHFVSRAFARPRNLHEQQCVRNNVSSFARVLRRSLDIFVLRVALPS